MENYSEQTRLVRPDDGGPDVGLGLWNAASGTGGTAPDLDGVSGLILLGVREISEQNQQVTASSADGFISLNNPRDSRYLRFPHSVRTTWAKSLILLEKNPHSIRTSFPALCKSDPSALLGWIPI